MGNPWTDLSLPIKGVSARRIDPEHPLDLFWAQDHLGHYLFVYEFVAQDPSASINLPNLVGIQAVHALADDTTPHSRLILLLNEKSDWEIFLALCNDLIQITRSQQNSTLAIQSMMKRLESWQEFLRNNRSAILGEDKIIGLIGELLFIRNHLMPVFGTGQAVRFWQGPEGAPQDFNVNEGAVEIKSRLGATLPYVRISSANQLCSQLPELYLFVFTLGKSAVETDGAVNLPGLISTIRNNLKKEGSIDLERFNDLLYAVGYFDSERYLDFNYLISDQRMYKVSQGFPRICPDELKDGVINVSYQIGLSECTRFEGKPAWLRGTI